MSDSSITITGHTGRAPDARYTPSGMAVVDFSVAVNHSRKQGNEWVDETSWVNVVAFGGLAENVAESVGKGTRVTVTGRISEDTWEDKDTGAKRSKLKVVADDVACSLKWATAEVTPTERDSDQGRQSAGSRGGGRSAAPSYDPGSEPF